MSEIKNTSCVRNIIRVIPVTAIEREPWREASILRRFNVGVHICTCEVEYNEYNFWTKHAFVFDSHFKPLNQSKYFLGLIDNRADAPICVLEGKERKKKMILRNALR